MQFLCCFLTSFLWKKDLSKDILQIQCTQFSQRDSKEVFTEVERQDVPAFGIWFCQLICIRYYFPQSSEKQSGSRSMLLYSTNYSENLREAASQNIMISLLLLCGPTVFRIWAKPNQTKNPSCTKMSCMLKINWSMHLTEWYHPCQLLPSPSGKSTALLGNLLHVQFSSSTW